MYFWNIGIGIVCEFSILDSGCLAISYGKFNVLAVGRNNLPMPPKGKRQGKEKDGIRNECMRIAECVHVSAGNRGCLRDACQQGRDLMDDTHESFAARGSFSADSGSLAQIRGSVMLYHLPHDTLRPSIGGQEDPADILADTA